MKWPKVVITGIDEDGEEIDIAVSQVGECVCFDVNNFLIVLDPSDANPPAYLDACAAAHVYDGGALALSRRWSRSADDVIRLRREAHQAAGRSLVTPASVTPMSR